MSMDSVLCDELLISIFQLLPPLSLSTTTSLVSKRWLRLSRHSTTSLSLHHLPFNFSLYPFLSSLSLSSRATDTTSRATDELLLSAISSIPKLTRLRLLAGPLSLSSLFSLSSTCPHLTSLTLSLSRPLNLFWISSFLSLKHLSVIVSSDVDQIGNWDFHDFDNSRNIPPSTGYGEVQMYAALPLSSCLFPIDPEKGIDDFDVDLKLESFSVTGLSSSDLGVGWFWRNCLNLRKLKLTSCDGVGDGGSFVSFFNCLVGLYEMELRSCRSIADMVLLKLGEYSTQLSSLLVYDGGSKDGLLRFIDNCRSNLRNLDLRLPLDLKNEHLSAMAGSFSGLSCLKLQSCCLVTGDGLKAFSLSLSNSLEELALINCDVVERVPGLLTTLGQNLKKLKKLDLSYNEMMIDKELVSMLVSCNCLVELNLRGCKGLTNMSLVSMVRICRSLECVDIVNCCSIEAQAVELFVLNSKRLKRVHVEHNKLSDHAKQSASNRFIEVVV